MHCFGSLVSCDLHHFTKYEKLIIYQQEIKIEWAKINIMNYAKKNIGESKTFFVLFNMNQYYVLFFS